VSDDTERIYELRDSVARDAEMYADAASRPLPGSALDEAGTIEVALDADGRLSVTIGEGWRSEYEPDELAGGVLQTFQELAAARTAGWATNLEGALEEERRNTPIQPVSETVAGKLKAALDDEPDGGAEITKVLENVLSFLEDVSANFDASFDQAVQRGRATHRSEPESRHLAVEVNAAGDLQSLQFSESWVSRASGAEISRELNDAIAHAHADGAARGTGPLDGTPLGKYQRFVDDPDSFVQFVRGKE
jgi:hypothetical protein